MSTSRSTSAHAVSVARIASAVAAPLAKVVRYLRREAEIARAERAMGQMNDQLLRDIGVHRSQIQMAARIGRAEHGRRYL